MEELCQTTRVSRRRIWTFVIRDHKFGPSSAMFEQHRPGSGIDSSWPDICRIWPDVEQFGPTSVGYGPMLAKFCPTLANFDQQQVGNDQARPAGRGLPDFD